MPDVRRPRSIILTQVLAIGIAVAAVFRMISVLTRPRASLSSDLRSLSQLPWVFLLLVFVLLTFWSLQARRPYGRWLAVGFILLLLVSSWGGANGALMRRVLSGDTSAPSQLPAPYLNYSSAGELRGAARASVLSSIAAVVLAAVLLRSKRVREFLSGSSIQDGA
jgi:hypothetical protein